MSYQSEILTHLQAWVGRDFQPGVPAQCMNFVRHALGEVGAPLASYVTKQPFDGFGTGLALASSLAGRDVGEVILSPLDLRAGDVLFFDDTYETGFPPGTITHVALATGPQTFIHRPTSARPVEKASVLGFWREHFRCAVRPSATLTTTTPASATDPEPERIGWKVFHGGPKDSALLDTVQIDANGRATMTAQILAALTNCDLVINNKARALRFQPRK